LRPPLSPESLERDRRVHETGALPSLGVLAALLAAARDRNLEVRRAAVEALGKIEPAVSEAGTANGSAIDALRKARAVPELAHFATSALARLAAQ
jgi:hypothetical protein